MRDKMYLLLDGEVDLLARKERPSLILCDVGMPGMDGGDVSKELFDDAEVRDIPVLFLSALVTSDDMKNLGHQTGGKVVISSRRGSKFRAFGGALSGRMLQTIPGRLIVQSWRSTPFRKSDADSTLILRFTPKGRSGHIDLVHVNVPNHDYNGVNKGWKNYYWKPWRKYLAGR